MDRTAVLQRLLEEERRVAIGWAGARGQSDPVAAIREVLRRKRAEDEEVDVKITVADTYLQRVFIKLCERYGLGLYRRPRQHRSTLMVRGPETFIHHVLWPLYNACADIVQVEINAWLAELLCELTGDSDAEA